MSDKLKPILEQHGISFSDSKFEMHMTLSNEGIRVDSFAITWPNNPCDGKRVARQVNTPKKKMEGWGKGVVCFYLVSVEKTPNFPDMEKFIEHYAKDTVKPPQPSLEPIVRVKRFLYLVNSCKIQAYLLLVLNNVMVYYFLYSSP